jgi:hypothetical protein
MLGGHYPFAVAGSVFFHHSPNAATLKFGRLPGRID